MLEIVPAILAPNYDKFVEAVRKIEPFSERVHLDILDGAFTPEQTIFGYEEVGKTETKLKFDVHLMVMHPAEYVPQWLMQTNADRFFIHAEAEGNLSDIFLSIRSQGKKAGIVLNPETATGDILEYLPSIDYIQFMTVHPGGQHRPFLYDMIDKISTFHDAYPDLTIAVDGGMNPDTVHIAYAAGAQIIVSGSYIMNSTDPAKAIAELKDNLQ
ncbi:MAG TPA: ribulose-phosphate 3-epimerase [Candidatus Paceibacterota bacterium]|nr:ribulose-phosphate 3-epimerase [Candidatus Paceibacterota bacterium]